MARSVVLEGENRVLFYRLFNGLRNEFGPAGAVEKALVETMTVARWRQMRIWSMEKAGLDYQISKQEEPVDAPTKAALAFSGPSATGSARSNSSTATRPVTTASSTAPSPV